MNVLWYSESKRRETCIYDRVCMYIKPVVIAYARLHSTARPVVIQRQSPVTSIAMIVMLMLKPHSPTLLPSITS